MGKKLAFAFLCSMFLLSGCGDSASLSSQSLYDTNVPLESSSSDSESSLDDTSEQDYDLWFAETKADLFDDDDFKTCLTSALLMVTFDDLYEMEISDIDTESDDAYLDITVYVSTNVRDYEVHILRFLDSNEYSYSLIKDWDGDGIYYSSDAGSDDYFSPNSYELEIMKDSDFQLAISKAMLEIKPDEILKFSASINGYNGDNLDVDAFVQTDLRTLKVSMLYLSLTESWTYYLIEDVDSGHVYYCSDDCQQYTDIYDYKTDTLVSKKSK